MHEPPRHRKGHCATLLLFADGARALAPKGKSLIELSHIRSAAERIRGKIHRTPLLSASALGTPAGVRLFLKCENLQKTGSFKPRGALNKILNLTAEERSRGLITVSAGNHAQAVAWAARQVGAPCAVVMPVDAPRSKIDAVTGYGAEVILHADRATLFDKLHQVREERGATFIHPFDDPVVLAGAGTTGLEIMEEMPDADVVIVPVGGGGLMCGVACATKALSPRTRVVAVELEAGPGLRPALDAGKPVSVPRPAHTLADGMTPPFVGSIPLEAARRFVDEIVTVSEDDIVAAMRLLITRAKLYVEGSGAAATAALLSGRVRPRSGALVVSIVSGGNVDLDRMCTALHSEPRV
jgi:threonine dehydratase